MSKDEIYYRLDKNNRIVEVGGPWDQAALDGGGDELVRSKIEGSYLFEHITGQDTRQFVWTLFDAVRMLDQPRKKFYRCDTPTERRNMELTIAPDDDNGLLVNHRLVSSEPRRNSVEISPATRHTVGGVPIVRCSNCNLVRVKGVWSEPDEIAVKHVVTSSGLPSIAIQVIYGVCSSCQSMASVPPHSR